MEKTVLLFTLLLFNFIMLSAQDTEPLPTATPLPARIVVDEGHVEEGLWEITWNGKWSHHCEEMSNRREQFRSYIEVHYNEIPRLFFSSARRKYEFKHLMGAYYERDQNGLIWMHEQQINEASPQALSGTAFSGWLEYRESGCHFKGTFDALLLDTENACLVANFFEVNIRAYPSIQSSSVGTLLDARRVIGKVWGDDNHQWWKLGEEEYVREDVVEATRSCEDIEVGQEIDLSGKEPGQLIPSSAFLYESPSLSSVAMAICHELELQIIEGPAFGFYEVECDGQSGFLEEKQVRVLNHD